MGSLEPIFFAHEKVLLPEQHGRRPGWTQNWWDKLSFAAILTTPLKTGP
jgi:hypothetical protein